MIGANRVNDVLASALLLALAVLLLPLAVPLIAWLVVGIDYLFFRDDSEEQ